MHYNYVKVLAVNQEVLRAETRSIIYFYDERIPTEERIELKLSNGWLSKF